MKKILITGAGSYIGTSFERYIKENYADGYTVEAVDMQDGSWREKSFSGYDSVFHVAGIAHSDNGKISKERESLYYTVNTDLAVETAKHAKECGVGQFIFMSSAIVYGESAHIGKSKVITKETSPAPANCYGDSKLKAEEGILALVDDSFKVVVLRPPMIYGKGCKGNYSALSSAGRKLPFFPYVKNQRSMIYITNFCEFVRLMAENEENGLFMPQNAEYSNTSELVKIIGEANGRKVRLVRGVAWLIKLSGHFVGLVNKAFGNLSYDFSASEYKYNYQIISLRDSIIETEKKDG